MEILFTASIIINVAMFCVFVLPLIWKPKVNKNG